MPAFDYIAQDKDGHVTRGSLPSSSIAHAQEFLTSRGYRVLSLALARRSAWGSWALFERVNQKDITILYRELSVLVDAQVSLVEAIRVLQKQGSHRALSSILGTVSTSIESGMKLSQALAQFPRVFKDVYIHMIRAGEASGQLSDVLAFIAMESEKEYDLRNRIRGALAYPAFILVALGGISLLMSLFVFPQLKGLFSGVGTELPLSTRVIVAGADFFAQYGILVVAVIGLSGALAIFLYRTQESLHIAVDKTLLRIPVIGELIQKISMARFARSMATLQKGGVDSVSALMLAAGSLGNLWYASVMMRAGYAVEGGGSAIDVLEREPLVPRMVTEMLSVGEQSGKTVEVLEKIADFYTREVDNSLATVVSIIEPSVMVVIGAAVFVMVSGILLPMYQIAGDL